MSKARSLSNLFSGSTDAATDAEVTAAISTHATAANGHVGRGNTASRPASPTLGDTYFDTSLDTLIMYASTGWVNIAPTPNPPTSVVATQLTATTASIAFTAPTTGPTANSYIVTSSGAHTANGSSSPITVTGLTFGSSYTFTVQSVGANGVGNASAASSSITLGLPTASGGTLASDSTYYYRTFTSTSSLTVARGDLSMDVLRIAGGGSGGGGASNYYCGAGGGAGGYVYTTSQSFSPNTYTVTVGGGGTNSDNGAGVSGNNSNITGGSLSLTAAVFGGGGGQSGAYGIAGASSGGSTHGLASIATSVAGQGFRGGAGGGTAGAGGGGAGAVGGDGAQRQGGSGGAGLNTWSSWASATSTGVSGYYAGGGGGGHSSYYGAPSPLENGGAGGGGRGSAGAPTAPTNGTANTGSGGGGGGGNGNMPAGVAANGGSGIVIVRYLKSAVA